MIIENDHPAWSDRSLTLICGPPGSGKTTLAHTLHAHMLDVGDIIADNARDRMRKFGRTAHRAGKHPHPDLAIVRGAPDVATRLHIEQMSRPARTIILLTDASTCHERVTQRDRRTPNGVESQHEEIDRWWQAWEADESNR